MADTTIEIKAPKRRSWLRRLAWIGGTLVALLVILYFVGTSGAFIRGVLLPRVGQAINADLTASDVELSPFSQISLRDVKLVPKGAEPLFTASAIRARYSLFSILGGKIAVDEFTVDSPTITLVENPDGTSNLDPLVKHAQPKTVAAPATPGKPSPPPVINIKTVAINNAMIRRVTKLKGGGQESVEVTGASLTISNLKNGAPGKMELKAALAMSKTTSATAAADSLQAKLEGNFTFDLAQDLKPATVKGNVELLIEKAAGGFADFAAFAAKLECDATPTEVKQIALRFTRADAPLGELRVSGPFDAAKTEGRLNVALLALDRRVLNLFGAASGTDFGTTTVNSTNQVELSGGGSVIAALGRLEVARFQIIRQSQTSPTFDLRADYNLTVNARSASALLQSINLAVTQSGRPLINVELTSPMTIAWGNTANAVGDAALNVNVSGLNLADWRTFAADLAPEGVANAKLKLLSQQGGKQLTFDLDSQVQNLSARVGTNPISPMDVHLQAHGGATDLKQINLGNYRVELAQQGHSSLTVSGSGTFDRVTQEADVQVAMQAVLGRLLVLFPQPGLNLSAGTVDFKGRLTSKQQTQTATGQLAFAGLTARYGDFRFNEFGSTIDFDIAAKAKQIEIRKAAGDLREGANPGGKFDASGNFDLAKKSGQVTVQLVGFNQNGLRPFLESALGDKKLDSVAVNATVSANFDAQGNSAAKADLQLTNLVVSDPKGQIPATPLEARLQVDAAVNKQVAQVRECQLSLTPTDRARNAVALSGTVDFSGTNAITGNLKLAADSLDVTRYYDLFGAKATGAEAKPAVAPPVASASTAPDKEPDAVNLPFKNFEADVSVGHFYLHEVDIANLHTAAKIDGGHLVVKPCQLTLNGAPVSATVDLDRGVPGFKYDVAFNADKVPMAPLVNSFQPDRKGQIGGALTATAQVKGAGVTGASLRKNLTGQFDVTSTNLNLSIANVRNKYVNAIINVIVGIPDLLRNPTATVGNFLGRLTGTTQKSSGWADELTAAPIDVIAMHGSAGDGAVSVQDAVVRSAAFQAQARGTITLQDILTNSTLQVPITVSLSHSLANKIGLASAGAPVSAYDALPSFLEIRGTLGKPDPHTDKVALAELAAKTGVGVAKQIGGATGGRVGSILNAVGGILGGNTAPPPADANTPSATQTNPPPQQPRRPGLLDLFGIPK